MRRKDGRADQRSRIDLDQLAERISTAAVPRDFNRPGLDREKLQRIVGRMTQEATSLLRSNRSPKKPPRSGATVVIAGPSKSTNTLTAQAVADDLGLPLYRVHMSRLVSKYIGETEKNLDRLFDTAEEAGVVLLFDEADALFGERSEAEDSRDRYANSAVSYLIERLEDFKGLSILAANKKSELDEPLLERLGMKIDVLDLEDSSRPE